MKKNFNFGTLKKKYIPFKLFSFEFHEQFMIGAFGKADQ